MTPLPSNEVNDLLMKCFAMDNLGNVCLRTISAALSDDAVKSSNIDWGTEAGQVSALDMPYEADEPTDWDGTPPATVQEAIDRIAAVVGVTPIP